ncbi:hypothetical protein P9112_008546 [Eukaryota sp. TZLM1-RC]
MDWFADDSQEEKLQETIDLLLVAGYFRARIASLTAFDRIIGGMSWCIAASNVDVDVSVVFVEDAPIKEKLKIAESIVNALHIMRCPFPLQPHQVSRLDLPAIFPIVQWLVKQAITFRSDTSARVRSFAEYQYSHLLSPVTQPECQPQPPKEPCNRCFRQPKKLRRRVTDLSDKVSLTLLEFGISPKKVPKFLLTDDDQEEDDHIEASDILKTVSSSSNVSTSGIEKALKEQSLEVQAAQAAYEKEVKSSQEEAQNARHLQLRRKREAVLGKKAKVEEEIEGTKQKIESTRTQITGVLGEVNKIRKKIDKFETLKTERGDDIDLLNSLLDELEAVSTEYLELKANSKQNVAELKEEIAKLKENESGNQEIVEKITNLTDVVKREQAKVDKLSSMKQDLSKNIEILKRKEDEFPIRPELVQFERRFSELFEALAVLLDESRRYYDRYNALVDQKQVFERELSLMRNLKSQTTSLSKDKSFREATMDKLATLSGNLNEHSSSLEIKADKIKNNLEQAVDEKNDCIQQIRSYYSMVRDLQAEMVLNDELRKN